MMLDKGQIGGWDGEPEDAPDAKKPAAQPAKVEAPVVSAMAAPEGTAVVPCVSPTPRVTMFEK